MMYQQKGNKIHTFWHKNVKTNICKGVNWIMTEDKKYRCRRINKDCSDTIC